MSHSLLRNAAPFGAAVLAAAAIAAPASAAGGGGGGGGGGGVIAAGGEIVSNTASFTLSGYPAGAVAVTVTRDGTTIATGTANVDGTGVANLNVNGIAAPEPLDCWTGFTPDLLPGDIINIGASAVPVGGGGIPATVMTVPNITLTKPKQVGSELISHGSALDATGAPLTGVSGMLFSPLARFAAGARGGSTITGALSFDNLATGAFTLRFAGLTPGDMAIGLSNAAAEVDTLPPAVDVAGVAAFTIGTNTDPAGPVAGCTAPLGSDAVTGASTKTINLANQNQAMTITGTSDPNVKGVTLTVGGSTFPATLAGGTWSATVNPSSLPDGTLTAAATFNNGAGSYHGRTMSLVKDTAAPSAPTASVASGAYPAAQKVSLSAESGASIYYTTNGSDPTTSSKSYSGAVSVGQTGPVKAIAVDSAGNVSDVARFDYVINPPATVVPSIQPATVKVPKLKVESLTLTRRTGLRSARKRGVDAIIYAPEGAKVAKIRILKGAKVIQTINRKVSRDGVLEVRVPSTKKIRRALKRGSYRVEIQVGQDARHLGVKMVRTIKLV